MIEVEHVCLSFGKRKILEDVNLTVYDGETMVILGASGSGKSTLLKLIIAVSYTHLTLPTKLEV